MLTSLHFFGLHNMQTESEWRFVVAGKLQPTQVVVKHIHYEHKHDLEDVNKILNAWAQIHKGSSIPMT